MDAWGRARGGERGKAERREREGGARTLIGQRRVPRPFMAAGPGYGSKTKGRRPARRRQEDASRPDWAPTAGARPGSHRDRLKTEPAPTKPGPDGRSGPCRGPPSGREYGRASGAPRRPEDLRLPEAGKHLLGAGGRGGSAEDALTFCSDFPNCCWYLVHWKTTQNPGLSVCRSVFLFFPALACMVYVLCS